MELKTPLSPWRIRLAVVYWLLVLFLTFFGDDHGYLIGFVTLPWSFAFGVILMLGEMMGIDFQFEAWWYPLLYVGIVLTLGGINAAWIAGLLGRTRLTLLNLRANKDSS